MPGNCINAHNILLATLLMTVSQHHHTRPKWDNFAGELEIGDKSVADGGLALLSEGDEVVINSKDGAECLILAGPELNEPIARYGPFVMNTREEISQAIDDYNNGRLA